MWNSESTIKLLSKRILKNNNKEEEENTELNLFPKKLIHQTMKDHLLADNSILKKYKNKDKNISIYSGVSHCPLSTTKLTMYFLSQKPKKRKKKRKKKERELTMLLNTSIFRDFTFCSITEGFWQNQMQTILTNIKGKLNWFTNCH